MSYEPFCHRALCWELSSRTPWIYGGDVVTQQPHGNNTPKVSYTRGRDLSGSLDAAGLPRQSAASAGGIGGLLARTDHSAGTHAYYHADGNGNITCPTDANQAVVAAYLYDPYGKILNQSKAKGVASEWQLVKPSMICDIWDRTRCWHSSDFGAEFPETCDGDTSGAGKVWGGV